MKYIYFVIAFSLLIGCATSHYPKKYEKLGIFSRDTVKEYQLNGAKNGKVSIQYLGCNNYIIKYKNDVICIDPFFSNNRFIKTGTANIQFKPKYFNKGATYIQRNNMGFKDIDAVFISHSHYDHILDLPYLLQHDSLQKSCTIYGDTSARIILQNFLKKHSFFDANQLVYKPDEPKWIYIGEHMRVLVMHSSHGPHYRHLHIMQGACDSNYFSTFTDATQKLNAHKFKEGNNFSFVIDVLENKQVVCRILNKTNGCEINSGKIDSNILKEHPIDIALLQIASSNYTDCIPHHLLSQTKPKQVIIGHWENFFKPYGQERTKKIPFTDFRVFFKRANSLKAEWPFDKLSDKFFMPKPGTTIHFYY
jgi:L-ascorbate metabolism protein UlaG (beta-lactamase superfamily)